MADCTCGPFSPAIRAAASGVGASGNFSTGDQRFFAAAGAVGGHDATDRVVYDTSTGKLYFDADGRPVRPADVNLTVAGREQARAAAAAFGGVRFDRVVTSGLARTLQTARTVAPDNELESWPELREIESGRLSEIPAEELEEAFLGAFRGRLPEERRFLGGEAVGSLLDRVLPALDRLLADASWDVLLAVLHGGGEASSQMQALRADFQTIKEALADRPRVPEEQLGLF